MTLKKGKNKTSLDNKTIKISQEYSMEGPSRGTPESAGIDIPFPYGEGEKITIQPNEIIKIDSGVKILNMPKDHCGLLVIRSGLAQDGLTLANGIGIIDPDFKDNIHLLLKNNNKNSAITIKHGVKVAQIVIIPFYQGEIKINRIFSINELIGVDEMGDYISDKELIEIGEKESEDDFWIPLPIRNTIRIGGFGSTN
jgi:dUTP pyrophosphatase